MITPFVHLQAKTLPSDFKEISAGNQSTCVLTNKKIQCWGDGFAPESSIFTEFKNPKNLVNGDNYFCVTDNDQLQCRGRKFYSNNILSPSLKNPRKVLTNGFHNCALDDDGVKCWGYNIYGQTDVPALKNPREISIGSYHSCALDDDGVKCWGNNFHHQLNSVQLFKNAYSLKSSGNSTCVVENNQIFCWGAEIRSIPAQNNLAIQQIYVLGDSVCVLYQSHFSCDFNTGNQIAAFIHPADDISSISNSRYHYCLVSKSQGLICSGRNLEGQTNVPNGSLQATDVAMTRENTCAVINNYLTCWGGSEFLDKDYTHPIPLNKISELKSQVSSSRETICYIDNAKVNCINGYGEIPELQNPKKIWLNESFMCAQDDLGIKCWGGEINKLIQPGIDSLTHATELAFGSEHFCAIFDKKVKCWGGNAFDQLKVPNDLVNPTQIAAYRNDTCVIDNGTVRCWGQYYRFNTNVVPDHLVNPRQLLDNAPCVLDDNGVHCWDSFSKNISYEKLNRTLKYPEKAFFISSVGYSIMCVKDIEALKCERNGSNYYGVSNFTKEL
jgi:alpha-tubulin suppressor-like RCC1 family protein